MMSLHGQYPRLPVATPLLKKIGRFLVYIALLALILPKGAAITIALLAACLPIGLASILAGVFPPRDPSLARSYRICVGLVIVLTAYLMLQSWRVEGNPLAHPIWANAGSLLGFDGGAISVAPGRTRLAIFTLVAPLLLYASTLALFDSDRAALRLNTYLGLISLGFAIFGLLQLGLFPRHLLFFEKTAYLGNLTSFFVNRNTSATFLGVGSLVVLSCLLLFISDADRPLRDMLRGDAPLSQRLRLGGFASAFALTLMALALTISRGALLSTLLVYLMITPLLTLSDDGRGKSRRHMSRFFTKDRKQLLTSALVVAAILLVGLVLGSQAMFRLEQQSVDFGRVCAYQSTWKAIADNWLFGTGFGTFQDVFPSYRDPTCSNVYAVFERAHNFYLEGLLGLGIGFVPLAVFVNAHVLSNLLTGWRRRRRLRFLPILGLGAVILVTLHGLVDFSLQIPGMAGFFAVYLGAVTVVCHGRPRDMAVT